MGCWPIVAATLALAGALAGLAGGSAFAAGPEPWITTWAATPAPRTVHALPAPFPLPATLENRTVRQVARISVGGNKVRVVLSNEFGGKPVTIGTASVALAGAKGTIESGSSRKLTWGGSGEIVIPPGAPVISDPVDLAARPLSLLSVSLFLPKKTALSTVHEDAAQTGFISAPGDFTRAAGMTIASTTRSRLFLSGIMTDARPVSRSIVFLGDSITDGFCSTIDADHRWPDIVAERLQHEGYPDVSVINESYSGNRVLANGMGTNALSRFDMSVLSHPRAAAVVMMMGINDIGGPGTGALLPNGPEPAAADIEAGYKQIITRAHEHGLRFIAVTLTPFADTFKGTPFAGYYTPAKEVIRGQVNAWIRANRSADGLIDFDKLIEDPNNPGHILPAYDCGDHLHPNDAGYRAMANSVGLAVLLGVRTDAR